jgi:hypothetical protein
VTELYSWVVECGLRVCAPVVSGATHVLVVDRLEAIFTNLRLGAIFPHLAASRLLMCWATTATHRHHVAAIHAIAISFIVSGDIG